MISLVIVVIHEGFDMSFKITKQEVVFKQDAVFQGLMPALYLGLVPLTFRSHNSFSQPFVQRPRDFCDLVMSVAAVDYRIR